MKRYNMMDDQQWQKIRAFLPEDLEASARVYGALIRAREIPSAEVLMRMVLAYAVTDLSMKDVAAWARSMKLAGITAPSFFYRLVHSKDWLNSVLAEMLQQTCSLALTSPQAATLAEGPCLKVADATVLTGPGATGTEWRVHVLVDPRSGRATTVKLTDEHTGEGFPLLAQGPMSIEKGDVILGDSAYTTARGIAAVTERGAHVVIRLNPHHLRLCNDKREIVSVCAWEQRVPKTGVVSFSMLVPVPPDGAGAGTRTARTSGSNYKSWTIKDAVDWIPVRVVATRMDDGKVLLVLSTLPESMADDGTVLELYRIRWQVELFFKRLKSLLHLDELPSRRGPTAQTWILARLLATALAQRWLEPAPSFSPCQP